jgi:DNA-binding NarL/FixJ family response regulator
MDKIRLVVVDDHEMVRYGLRALLEAEADMVVVGEAGTGEEAVRMAHELRPDVMLLDVKLTNMDGPEVCRRVLSVSPEIAVVMLTSYTQEGVVLQSLAAGAKGFVVKDIELAQLKSAIRSVYRGHTVLDPKITGALIPRVTGQNPRTEGGRVVVTPTAVLADLEVRIVRHLSEGHTIKEIAERVHLSSHTIKDRLAKIREKLAVRSRTGIVAEAVKRGLI